MEPNECIFVIRSMVGLADASFRRGRGSMIIQGARRVYRLSKAREKAGCDSASFFGSAAQPFLCQGNAGRDKSARVWPTSQRHYKV